MATKDNGTVMELRAFILTTDFEKAMEGLVNDPAFNETVSRRTDDFIRRHGRTQDVDVFEFLEEEQESKILSVVEAEVKSRGADETITPEQYFKDVHRDEEEAELYDSRNMKGGRVVLRIRVVESEDLRLAARTSAYAHIAEVRDDVAPSGYLVCDTVELLQADGTGAAISILTDSTRTDLYLSLASIEGVPAGISTPRTMTHKDDHFPLHPLNEHETIFRVMGLSLETLESWDGHAICLETDK